ncbi:hypothetical protein [Leucobacter tenebrionis]|nr:hypothetical protein [Leucobacter tenebrionis]
MVVRVDGRDHPEEEETVIVQPSPERVHLFHVETGDRIGSLTRRG